jgi:rapamycin-insensitive companion of mTOR
MLPAHLLGELAQTRSGVELIEKHGIMQNLSRELMNAETTLLQKRAALWAIGQIGKSERGVELVLRYNIVEHLAGLGERSEWLSLRGISLYALSLIARTVRGKEVLAKLDWECQSHLGSSVCLPKDVQRFFTVQPSDSSRERAEWMTAWKRYEEVVKSFAFSEEKRKVLSLIGNLSNHVTQKTALPELKKITSQPNDFFDESLFYCVNLMLTYYSFKLQVRRYILSHFERLFATPNFLPNYSKIVEAKKCP